MSTSNTSQSPSSNELIYVKRGAPKYSQSGMTIRGKAQSTGVVDDLYFNPQYFCTNPGVIKLIELVTKNFSIKCLWTFLLKEFSFFFVFHNFLSNSPISYSELLH